MTIGLIFACWTLYGLFFGAQAIAQQAYRGEPITWKRDLLSWLVCGYVWAILTPPVLYLSERFRLDRRNWTRAILIHLPASILFAILLLLIYVAVSRFIGLPVKPKPYLLEFKNLFIVEFHLGLLTYWVILGIRSAGRVFFLKTEEIDWIEAAGNYVRLHTGRDAHLLRETMNALEAKLDPDKFLRIHRSTIINIERIKEMHPLFRGEHVVILRDGTRLTLGRGYRDRLQELLGSFL